MVSIEYINIAIFYFSGTGNTKEVAQIYASRLRQRQATVDLYQIEHILKNHIEIDFDKYEMLGFGFPVHAFSAPSIFYTFIHQIPNLTERKKSFLFKTMGDPLFFGGSTKKIRLMLKRKGYDIFHEDFLVMPSNIVIDYPKELKNQLYHVASRKINLYAYEILNSKNKLQPNSKILNIISNVSSLLETIGAQYFGRYLIADENCTLCKQCIQLCPTNNITIKNDRIIFGDRCCFCMRCTYRCPEHAITNKYMNFMILRNQYQPVNKIITKEMKKEYITKKTRGYFKHFYKYLHNELYF
ncbi:MAG: hypothetical protein BAJALOKI1v1_90006 [Promethearchaeota archaeon]|nr:MAG: hypothetical protein BAJALOKI1v1_90006 [Candidatus Lokiarchaeota archaeon]